MPISRELFERGLDPVDQQIIDLLDTNSDQAYSFDEIASAIGQDLQGPVERVLLGRRVLALVDKRLITCRTIGGTRYYASAKPQPL